MTNKGLSLLFIVLLFCISGIAQEYSIKGKVQDADTREALAFVNIMASDGRSGTSTDIDGKFTLHASSAIRSLKLSYVGYEPLLLQVEAGVTEVLIRLKKTQFELSEVVVRPGINPAHRIIRSVLENRFVNDHEKMNSFSYSTYEKLTFGPETDSIPWSDSMLQDTSAFKMKEFFDRQHLFLMESVTERKFMYPDKNYNKVVASRVSGFGDPLFVFMMSQLQSTSFYKEIIQIGDKNYINPISNGTFSKYYFEIQDTLIEAQPYDTTYIISFRPLMNTNFDGLKGVISISTNEFAIRNVIAQPARDFGGMTIKIQQLYDFVQGDHWFPIQLNTDIIFQKAIGRGSIQIGVGSGTRDSTHQDLVGRGKSYISNIRLNPPLRRNEFGFVDVDVMPDAYRKPEVVWNSYRSDSLSRRDLNTYRIIDSIGKVNNFDRMGYKLDALLNGKIPLGPLDLELDKIVRINMYEGLRLGVGAHTNDKLSTYFQLGGYGAYGFTDNAFKYGGNFSFWINRRQDSKIRFELSDDVDEAGAENPFMGGRNLLDLFQIRELLVRKMDHNIKQQVLIGTRLFKYASADIGLARSYSRPLYDYRYITDANGDVEVSSREFHFTEALLLVRYAYGEKFLRNTRSLISMGTTYPIIWIYLGHGMNSVAGGEYTFNRVMVKAKKTFTFKYLGSTTLTLFAGMVDRDVPYPALFNAVSDYTSFTFYSLNSFATMRMNEFASDRYANLFFTHDFRQLLFRSKHFNPRPAIVTNIGIGFLSHPEDHGGVSLKGYDKGYIESGLLINNLLNLGITRLGIGSFYRYGPYAMPEWKDNLAFKLTLGFNLP